MTKYRLFLVRVFTFDWERAFEFYRDVLEFEVSFVDAEIGWAQFQLGDADLAIERCDPEDEETKGLVGRFVGISIGVDDIEATYRELAEKGVEFIEKPTRQPWGGILAHFKDPEGNVLTLVGGD